MTFIEVIILIVGILVFILSFILPEKKAKLSEDTIKLSEDTIKKMVEEEMKTVRSKAEDTVQETLTYSMEKTERAVERLTNEKIMAINEYSDTVLNEIHKNHEEVVFIYDMLNDKQKVLKKTVQEVDQVTQKKEKEINEQMIPDDLNQKNDKKEEKNTENESIFTPFVIEKTEMPKKSVKQQKTQKPIISTQTGSQEINRAEKNSKNQTILKMHEQGKSNMAIARELGLGIGEVKLIIDLYQGGK